MKSTLENQVQRRNLKKKDQDNLLDFTDYLDRLK